MIKVAIVSGDSSLTGVPSHIITLAKGLDKKKFDVLVICPPGPLARKLSECKIACAQVPMRSIFDRKADHDIRAELVKFRPQIAHFHGMRAGWLGRLAARKIRGIKKIYSEHQWVDELHLSNVGYEKIQLQALKFLDRWTDKTVAVSKPVYDFLIKQGFEKNKIVIIPNGVSGEFLETKTLSKPPELPPIIGTVASLNEVKNYRNIILAIAKVKKLKPSLSFGYQIVGEGPEKTRLVNLVKNKKLENVVHFAGRVGSVPERMQHFSIYLNASKSETFGLAVAEAMAMGIPVIVSQIPALQYVVGKNAGLYIDPRSNDKIADAIIRLLTDKTLRAELGQAGRKRIEEEFSEEKMVSRISGLYEKIVK